jgi:hypothetical protein
MAVYEVTQLRKSNDLAAILASLVDSVVCLLTDSPRPSQPDPALMATALYFLATIGAISKVLRSR